MNLINKLVNMITNILLAAFAIGLLFAFMFSGRINEFLGEEKKAEASMPIEEEVVLPEDVNTTTHLSVPIYSEQEIQEIAKKTAKSEGVPWAVMETIILKESSPAWNQFSFRFEPHKRKELGDAGACSYGITQVLYGYHKKTCGLENPLQLYNPEIAVKCGAMVLKSCYRKAKGGYKQRVRDMFKCYNGSGADADRYANDAMSKLDDMLYKNIKL